MLFYSALATRPSALLVSRLYPYRSVAAEQRYQAPRDRLERQCFFDCADRDRLTRHTEHHAACLVLGDGVGAGLFHLEHASRAVLAHSRKNDADGIATSLVGDAAKQQSTEGR